MSTQRNRRFIVVGDIFLWNTGVTVSHQHHLARTNCVGTARADSGEGLPNIGG
jgi:hypothetical protein